MACDPAASVFFVGSLDLRELPALFRIQKTCSIFGSVADGWVAVPLVPDPQWAPLRIRFALGSADAFWSESGFAASFLTALGEVRMVPGGHTALQLGEHRLLQKYTVVPGASAPGAASGQIVSGFEADDAGLNINVGVERVIGGVVLDGSISSSSFTLTGSKDEKSITGKMQIRIGRWEPLVVFGSVNGGWPVKLGMSGLAVYVRADYVE